LNVAEHISKRRHTNCRIFGFPSSTGDSSRPCIPAVVKADDFLTAFLSLERDTLAPKGANGNATSARDCESYEIILNPLTVACCAVNVFVRGCAVVGATAICIS